MSDPAAIREAVIEVLRTVYDPEIPVNIYELGLVYGIDVDEENHVKVRMTLTSPMCPVAESLPPEVEQKVRAVPGVAHADVDLTWEPPWNPSMMTRGRKAPAGVLSGTRRGKPRHPPYVRSAHCARLTALAARSPTSAAADVPRWPRRPPRPHWLVACGSLRASTR